jgi:hypothetical protein
VCVCASVRVCECACIQYIDRCHETLNLFLSLWALSFCFFLNVFGSLPIQHQHHDERKEEKPKKEKPFKPTLLLKPKNVVVEVENAHQTEPPNDKSETMVKPNETVLVVKLSIEIVTMRPHHELIVETSILDDNEDDDDDREEEETDDEDDHESEAESTQEDEEYDHFDVFDGHCIAFCRRLFH